MLLEFEECGGLALKPPDFGNIEARYGSNQSDVERFDDIFAKSRYGWLYIVVASLVKLGPCGLG